MRVARSVHARCAVALAASLTLLGVGAAVATSAQAGTPVTVYVSTGGSDGADCLGPATACATVSEGVTAAQTVFANDVSNSSDVTVSIAAGNYFDNVSIDVPDGDILTLAGHAAGDTSINGGGNGSVITVNAGVVTVSDLTVTGGNAFSGGGIFNYVGTVTVSASTLSGNTASYGGGIYNLGTVTVSASTLSDNAATFGGGIYSGGPLTVSASTLSGNTSAGDGGGIDSGGTLTVSASTLSANTSTFGGGGGIYNGGTGTVSGSTLSANTATHGGGIANYGTLTLSGSTLSANTASTFGGGIYNAGTAAVSGSILSGSPCGGGSVTDGGFNVASDHLCVGGGGSSVVDSASIDLGALAANGSTGPLTQAIDATSSAHQLVPTSSGLCAGTDERGLPRPGVSGASGCDAGAFELQAAGGPTSVGVTVSGSERVGGTASFSTTQTLPSGITLTGTVTCTAVTEDEGDAPIATLAAGGYTVDPTTCSGLSLTGTGSDGYTISYTGGTFTAIALTPAKLKAGRTGSKYTGHLTATGGTAPYTYSVTGSLPPGVTLSSAGVFGGTPTVSGPSAFTVAVTDANTVTVSADYTLLIGLQITPAKLLLATYNKAYNAQLGSNGTGAQLWAIASGTLPAGLSINASTGKISGTPTSAGHNSFVVQVTDSASPAQTGRITYYLTVQLAAPTILKSGTHGKAYNATLTAAGGTAPYTWTTSGTLPDGLDLNSTGTITGTPTTAGKYQFSLTVTDAATPANTLTQSYSVVIK